MSDITKLVQDLKQSLLYQKQLGLEWVPKGESKKGGSEKPKTLEEIRAEIGDCKRCRLCEGRKNIVFGVGSPKAQLMFIGEGPGRDEDIQGEPFVGRAGQLLTKIIEAMGLKRSTVYIANIAKCRPPENRAPLPDEAATCIPFLHQQIETIKPKVIVCLGSVAFQYLLETDQKISAMRGQWQEFRGIKVMPTYHPAFLLRNPDAKRPVWEDMKKVRDLLQKT
ncbi:MAG: uracil-DNA glycosylase [Deltaproteobacteria bacterium RIFCSPLOWO2_01_44_7]|nr:MAG: uracil-DNA glycosylase [Deltaproteobacteria bacterium RIFCSPHIGHO2_01_FULL_43_49]OGQ14686.1 MAG: uracil-DNA glycosylase [Deltaproteobacteria bacterium RIFCSPHIGHO2_02_FULL_44_53]OGQ28072.1 MAG: uracil-DNA glycosylase [Deltaproteobacteria bacterium RIFCSPHIGHO2_12_FULL_44_21]OGQ31284.1 MAG: uracil-DNA glycosylase [Deltaproteobacteria bacterium RIFCSPLOWO2_01_FULL_45_74]OGQ39915.1 MAG: uracil-DNA glycosylase [Deltaproteobacteria bacterium RIFCSPLOWO2_01_44_7]OGQ43276.1 MAG: uracil-DNA gl